MTIGYKREFCMKTGGAYDDINFVQRDTQVTKPGGEVVFHQKNVGAPDFWSDRALRTAAQKYFVRPGVSEILPEGETSVQELCGNVAATIAEAGVNQKYLGSPEERRAFEDDLLWLLIRQYGAFNSPVWFNCRRWHMYGIAGKGGNWVWEPFSGQAVETTNAYENPQCSACFLVPVGNSIVDGEDSILDHLKNEARIFKYGSGSGTNFSAIQEKNSRTDSGGKASGLITFMRPSDTVAGVIKSGGTTRRAAKMICVDLDHPEIEDFIDLKMNEEKKALVLARAGYGYNMEDESFMTVTGQNANNSVRVPDAFFQAVEDDGDWSMTSRRDGKIVKTVKARDLFHRIATAAWNCADPGIHYDSAQQRWHTCKVSGPIRESNPCSEYLFLTNTACNLASLKLTKFLKADGTFDVNLFYRAVRTFITAQDILVDFSSYPTKAIAENSHKYRTLGLGYMDLGAVLMLKGLPYDSMEGRHYAAAITSLMSAVAFERSAELARELGPFKGFAENREAMLAVVTMHREATSKVLRDLLVVDETAAILSQAWSIWDNALTLGMIYGFRNAQLTLLAPCGTIGYLVDAETTGVEPNLGLMLYKELAGGGTVELPNRLIGEALRRMGYDEAAIDSTLKYVNEELSVPDGKGSTYKRGSVVGAPALKPKHYAVFDCAFPPPYSKGPFIRPEGHVLMMAAVQPFLSGAISKTCNMPSWSTVEDVKRLYMLGWKEGLKALAVYRDGSKGAQPVTTTLKTITAAGEDPFHSLRELPIDERVKKLIEEGLLPEGFGSRKKMPKKRRGTTQALKIDGQDIYFRSGEYPDGSLGEVWIDVKNDGGTVSGLAGALARSISLGLQHGTPLRAYADLLLFSRFEPHGLVQGHPEIKSAQSIVDLLMRWLMVEYGGEQAEALKNVKMTVEEPIAVFTGDGPPCTSCGCITKRNGACYRCPNCSETSGCS